MTHDLAYACQCGKVRGSVRGLTPRDVNHVICYCDDCQAFLQHLERVDLLDASGGTAIVQVAPAMLSFEQGAEQLACLRLSAKGLYRWYTSCCRTPAGNTLSGAIPVIGLHARSLQGSDADRRTAIGPPVGAVFGKFAIGAPPPGSSRLTPRLILRFLRLLLTWKLRGQGWPHPYFERASGRPIARPITVLSSAQRQALRSLCGPAR